MEKPRAILLAVFFFLVFATSAQTPPGYYDPAEGLSGGNLKAALNDIIKGHTEFPYTASTTDTWDILKETDPDPENPDNVLGLYSAFSMNAALEFDGGDGWTREHVWAKSRGDFGTSLGAGTDVHHLRPEDASTNSARSNRNFDEATTQYTDGSGQYSGETNSYTGGSDVFTWEPRDEVKGDVARMLFYMATRYEGEGDEPDLELIESYLDQGDKSPYHAKRSVLIGWHQEDPVDEYERNRNNVIYGYQGNRNPFIDHPEYVSMIWSETVTSVEGQKKKHIEIYPNPVEEFLRVKLNGSYLTEISIFDLNGKRVFHEAIDSQRGEAVFNVKSLKNGMYFASLSTNLKSIAFRVIKK